MSTQSAEKRLEALIDAVASSLNLDASAIEPTDSFANLGGDSLASLYVAAELMELGLALDPLDLLEDIALMNAVNRIVNLP